MTDSSLTAPAVVGSRSASSRTTSFAGEHQHRRGELAAACSIGTTAVPTTNSSIISPVCSAALPTFHGCCATVLLLGDRDADDPGRAELLGLVLQPLDRELARVVQRVRVAASSMPAPARSIFGVT